MSNTTFRLTAGTNVGCVRSNNEDNFTVNCDLTQKEWFLPSDSLAEISLGEAGCLFVVADGMGGMNAGEVASDIAVKTIEELFSLEDFSEIISSENSIKEFMLSAVVKADSNIKKRVKEDPSTSGMGTTIVVAWVIGNIAHIVWCGDSRAYRFNREFGLTQLTKDHSYVQQLVDEGKLEPELAFDHPYSNVITRSLGDTKSQAEPDYRFYNLAEGDYILLCTDGLCGLCRDEEILAVLNEHQEKNNIVESRNALINAALEAGGYDNVTVVLFQQVQTEEKKNEYTNTIAYKRKPLYKKPTFWILTILIMVVLFVGFAPNKWLGTTISGYRTRLFDKSMLCKENLCNFIEQKKAEREAKRKENEAAKAADIQARSEATASEASVNQEKAIDTQAIDKALEEDYQLGIKLREHTEAKVQQEAKKEIKRKRKENVKKSSVKKKQGTSTTIKPTNSAETKPAETQETPKEEKKAEAKPAETHEASKEEKNAETKPTTDEIKESKGDENPKKEEAQTTNK